MKKIAEEESNQILLKNGTFADYDLCHMTLETDCDVNYRAQKDYLIKSLTSSGMTNILWEVFSNDQFENHPLKEFFKTKIDSFEKKNFENAFKESLLLIPDFTFYEIRHDEKMLTMFFNISFFATIGQIKTLPDELIDNFYINVKTSVGNFQII